MPKHRSDVRDALIRLFEELESESYKAGRLVLQSILGRDDLPLDRPILDFNTNPLLTALARPGVTPIVWDKAQVVPGRQDGPGAAGGRRGRAPHGIPRYFCTYPYTLSTYFEFIVHTRTYKVQTSTYLSILVHTGTYTYIHMIA